MKEIKVVANFQRKPRPSCLSTPAFSCFSSQSGFGILETMISLGILLIAIMALTTVSSNVFKVSRSNTTNTSYLELRSSLLQATLNGVLCTTIIGKTTVDLTGLQSAVGAEIEMTLPDGTVVKKNQNVWGSDLTVKSLRVAGSVNLGADPTDASRQLYTGSLILSVDRNGEIYGSTNRQTNIGLLTLSLSSATSQIVSCWSPVASPIVAGNAVGGAAGSAAAPVTGSGNITSIGFSGTCPVGNFMIGMDTSTGIQCAPILSIAGPPGVNGAPGVPGAPGSSILLGGLPFININQGSGGQSVSIGGLININQGMGGGMTQTTNVGGPVGVSVSQTAGSGP